ncbi:hypothetical protein ACVRY7_10815, partial [Streptococcus ictaluri]
ALVELPSHSWQSQLPDTHDMEINCLKKKALYKCCTEKCCLFKRVCHKTYFFELQNLSLFH